MADVIDSKKVAMNIRVARAKKGMSQKELTDKSGVCETTISFIENGKQDMIRMSTLQKLALALEVDVEELLN